MPTRVLNVNPFSPADPSLELAAEVLRRGGLVAFPTETVYGLGANALDADAVRRIFAAKGRPARNPLIVHVAEVATVAEVVAAWPEAAEQLARRFWPGPLTLVLPRNPEVADLVTAGGPTVAVRVPAHPVARRLIQLAGVPIAAPSANRSGEISPTTAEHVRRSLDGRIDLILDGGPTQVGLESTVLSLAESPPRMLRPGMITAEQIEAIVGPIQRPPDRADGGPLPSPGLLSRHYAPRTPTECVEGRGTLRVIELASAGLAVGWLTQEDTAPMASHKVIARRMPARPAEYAAQLYATLHDLDAAGLDRIVVDLPPDGGEWLAVRDRLRRAAAQD